MKQYVVVVLVEAEVIVTAETEDEAARLGLELDGRTSTLSGTVLEVTALKKVDASG